jgi:hypothetical protein
MYEGQMMNGKMNGKGKLNRKDGIWYDAEFRDGVATGWSTMYYTVNNQAFVLCLIVFLFIRFDA